MPLTTNGIDLLGFFSEHPIDMVVHTGEITVTNSGATTQAPQEALIVSSTIDNPYNKRALVRAKYSVDGGTNYQSLDSRLIYTFSLSIPAVPITVTLNGLQAALNIGVSDDSIIFRTASGYHGNVVDTGTYAYTPISQDFLIKYAIFEAGV